MLSGTGMVPTCDRDRCFLEVEPTLPSLPSGCSVTARLELYLKLDPIALSLVHLSSVELSLSDVSEALMYDPFDCLACNNLLLSSLSSFNDP